MIIRDVKISDAREILDIYAPYIEDTAVTFEYDVPSLEEFEQRIENITKKYPYIVAEEDGKVVGYAYASAVRSRQAFQWVVETSIYIDKAFQGQGLGRKLYGVLEDKLREGNFRTMYVCISWPEVEDEYLTKDSVLFHEKMGFKRCGSFRSCGLKFDRWYDVVWMEKFLTEI